LIKEYVKEDNRVIILTGPEKQVWKKSLNKKLML
jgi:hypothetical protein